jgi:carboxylate-amine ligase
MTTRSRDGLAGTDAGRLRQPLAIARPGCPAEGDGIPVGETVALLLSAGSAGELHAHLLAFCTTLLGEARIVRSRSKRGDRATHVELAPEQVATAAVAALAYRRWVEGFVADAGPRLSSSDVHLLRANASEIGSYLQMSRRGQDLGVVLYKRLFFHELQNLMAQQEGIVKEALSLKPAARRRTCWRGVPLTVGVEEELQIVSVDDWELKQGVDTLMAAAHGRELSREVYKSQIETKTGVCESVAQVDENLRQLRRQVAGSLPAGLAVLAAGTHPFSTWNQQEANRSARTDLFMHDMQDVVRRLVTFGLHVHVGVEDRELAVKIMTGARRFLPLLLAVSASSPFWEGRLTGLASYRSTLFSALPRTGVPPTFESYGQYEAHLKLLGDTGSFDSLGSFDPTKIWWDIRLHPRYRTVEFRICDACTRVEDAVCITALCQALVAKLAKLLHTGAQLRECRKEIVDENKWRALRYGHRAKFIDPERGQQVSVQYCALELLDFLEDVLDELGSADQARHILHIIGDGTSAARQVGEFIRSNDVRSVVRNLSAEFLA